MTAATPCDAAATRKISRKTVCQFSPGMPSVSSGAKYKRRQEQDEETDETLVEIEEERRPVAAPAFRRG